MIRQLFMKWFGIQDESCQSCEIYRVMLERSEKERVQLLDKLINVPKVTELPAQGEEFKPITPPFTPWRVRQQLLEAEDRRSSQLLKQSAKDIADLEKELGVAPTASGD